MLSRSLRLSAAAAALAAALAAVADTGVTEGASPETLAVGRAIYLEGRLPSGAPLTGTRPGGLVVEAREAACVNCHRRSGLGAAEGRSYIPAINGAHLFPGNHGSPDLAPPSARRGDYTAQGLARALRAGVDPAGRELDVLMPRYALDDSEMSALIAYLRSLSARPSPGAGDEGLRFATVVTPGVEPARSRAMIETLKACFDERNAGPAPEPGRDRLATGMERQTWRPWTLDVWQLEGVPETWLTQLEAQARARPAFAIVGGVGAGSWAPVHAFCEANGLPCLFPHVELPVARDGDFYTVYWNRGVLLDAALVANHLVEQGGVKRVVQVARSGDAGAGAGAQALRAALAPHGVKIEQRSLAAHFPTLASALKGLVEGDAAVLWLRGADLQGLGALKPAAKLPRLYVSGTLTGGDVSAVPAAWRSRVLMAYPLALPDDREARSELLRLWLQARAIPLVDELLQADALFGCALLGIGVDEIADHLYRDFLLERIEVVAERRRYQSLYPLLALGPGQRFASKSGYIVRMAGDKVIAVGGRRAP